MTDKNAAEATQDALKASLERAQQMAKDAAETGSDIARKIQDTIEGMLERSKAQTERSRDAALEAVASMLEQAQRLASETQDAGTDAYKEVQGSIDKAIDTVRARIGGSDPEADKPYEDWTKDELYDRAQTLNVKGRAGMKKKELIKALRKRDAAA